MRIIALVLYFAIGAVMHALIAGPSIDWTSAWSIAWLLGWPIMLIAQFALTLIAGAMLIGIGWAVYAWIELIAHRRSRRRLNEP